MSLKVLPANQTLVSFPYQNCEGLVPRLNQVSSRRQDSHVKVQPVKLTQPPIQLFNICSNLMFIALSSILQERKVALERGCRLVPRVVGVHRS